MIIPARGEGEDFQRLLKDAIDKRASRRQALIDQAVRNVIPVEIFCLFTRRAGEVLYGVYGKDIRSEFRRLEREHG